MSRAPIRLLELYRYFVSPLLGSCCRFHPSCSSYAIQALEQYGAGRGTLLALGRIARCHPWHAGGFDPVPPPVTRNDG